MTLILSNDEIGALLTMPDCIATLEQAYRELPEGLEATRTRADITVPAPRPGTFYSLKSMDGVVPSLGVGAVRIKSDILTWPKQGGNTRRVKIPAAPNQRYVGLVLLFSCETGEPLAIFPDGVMQRIRVGATNGLGIKYLARADAEAIGILGSGWQAGAQLAAAVSLRKISTIRCFSPNKVNREAFVKEASTNLGINVEAVDSPEAAVADADIVICATNALDSVFFARWIEPGMHLSSITETEIDPDAIRQADRVVIHTKAAAPMNSATKDIMPIDFARLPTLPDLVSGRTPGRSRDNQVTCFLNNFGLGYQFAAAGAVVYRKAREAGIGRDLPTDWFTEDVHP